MPAVSRRSGDPPRELRRIRVGLAAADRDEHSGIRRPRCSPAFSISTYACAAIASNASASTRSRNAYIACAPRPEVSSRAAARASGAPGDRALERMRVHVRHRRHQRAAPRNARHRARIPRRRCAIVAAGIDLERDIARPAARQQRVRGEELHAPSRPPATSATRRSRRSGGRRYGSAGARAWPSHRRPARDRS